MVLESSLARLKIDSSTSPSKASPPARNRGLETQNKAEAEAKGANLADLCEEDKAKVARLINQVLLAFREIHKLSDLLEDERKSHESITSKLREQNQEMAAEVSPPSKACIDAESSLPTSAPQGKTASSLTPIGGVESSEPGIEVTDIRDGSSMKEKAINQLVPPAETESAPAQVNEERFDMKIQNAEFQVSSGPRGKENKDPELSARGADAEGSRNPIEQEQEGVPQKRRPLPRPLPDLVVNILHKSNELMSPTLLDIRARTDTTISRSTVVATGGQKQSSASTDSEPGRPPEPALDKNHLMNTEGRQSEVLKCPDIVSHKYYGESDESLRSSKSTKKMRFDPTAGEEGKFYYASDVNNSVCEHIQWASIDHQEDSRGQSRVSSVENACTRCSKPVLRKKADRDCHNEKDRRKSIHGVASVDERELVVNQQKNFAECGGHGSRNEDFPTVVYTTDEDYGQVSGLQTRQYRAKSSHVSAMHGTSSNLCSRHVNRCERCSSPLVRKLHTHRDGKKRLKERQIRRSCQTEEDSHTSSTSTHSSYSRTRIFGRCVRCSNIVTANSTKKSTRKWKATETETDSYSSDEGRKTKNFHIKVSSGKKNTVRCEKYIYQIHPKGARVLEPITVKGREELITGTLVDQQTTEPRVMVYDTSGEGSRPSVQSTAAFADACRERFPLYQPIACSTHKLSVGERNGERPRNPALEVEEDQRSEPTSEVYYVNHEKVESLLQSETEYSDSVKGSSLVDVKELKPKNYDSQKRAKDCCRASAEGRLELGSTLASNGQTQTESVVKSVVKNVGGPPIALPITDCKVPMPERWTGENRQGASNDVYAGQGDMETEEISVDVEDLLGRFIRKNAECAAELMNCSKYFQSTASKILVKHPQSNKKISIQNDLQDNKANQPKEQKPKVNQTCQIHLPIKKPPLEQFARCTGCLIILKPEVIRSVEGKSGLEEKDAEALCGKCSTSRAILKSSKFLSSTSKDLGKDKPTDPLTSIKIQVQGEARPADLSLTSPGTKSILRRQDHEMPTVADVSLSAQEANDLKVEETEDWHTGPFDISLFHLVNDLEVEDTEYWNHINTLAMDENTGIRWHDTRKRMMLDKGRASTISRWCHPKKHPSVKQFR